MNLSQREAWAKMIELLKEAQGYPLNSAHKTNRLLEAVVYGIGTLVCSEERNSSDKKWKSGKSGGRNANKQSKS